MTITQWLCNYTHIVLPQTNSDINITYVATLLPCTQHTACVRLLQYPYAAIILQTQLLYLFTSLLNNLYKAITLLAQGNVTAHIRLHYLHTNAFNSHDSCHMTVVTWPLYYFWHGYYMKPLQLLHHPIIILIIIIITSSWLWHLCPRLLQVMHTVHRPCEK